MTQPETLALYRPDNFSRAYVCLNGAELWSWLQHSQQLLVMEIACNLRRPAVEALSPFLAQKFPQHLEKQLFRQMAGHMVRQILEQRGFALDRNNVRIRRTGNKFRCGSTYRMQQAA